MSAPGMNAIYIPVAWLEFSSFNELSHSIYEQGLSHGSYFCSAYGPSGGVWMLVAAVDGAGFEGTGGLVGASGGLPERWLALGRRFCRLPVIILIIAQLSVGGKAFRLPEGGLPPSSTLCCGSEESLPFKVNVKLI